MTEWIKWPLANCIDPTGYGKYELVDTKLFVPGGKGCRSGTHGVIFERMFLSSLISSRL